MNFLEECIQDSLPIWESCLNTKFLKGVADGSLPEECFKGYIVDDSLYLRELSLIHIYLFHRGGAVGGNGAAQVSLCIVVCALRPGGGAGVGVAGAV